jgi:uncharacterized protein (TIGR03000 family)
MEEVAGESHDHVHHTGLWFSYDDVNGTIYDGNAPGAYPPAGPALEYEPRTSPKKEGELVEPPMPKKTAVPTTTRLVLNVPADAQVTLAGVDTKSSGATREFVTTLLNDASWSDYTVRVEFAQPTPRPRVDERPTLTIIDTPVVDLEVLADAMRIPGVEHLLDVLGARPRGEFPHREGGEVSRLVLDLDGVESWRRRGVAFVRAAVVREGRSHRVATAASAPRR